MTVDRAGRPVLRRRVRGHRSADPQAAAELTPAGKNRREAERLLAELVQARNGRGPVFPGRTTWRTTSPGSWLPARRSSLRPTTFGRYEREILARINPLIGDIPLHHVRAAT